MAGNKVNIQLTATDNASNVFANMTKNIRDGTLQANLMGASFNAAMNAIKGSIGALSGAISEAATIESSSISTAGTLMKMIGLNFNDATSFIEGFSDRMSIAAASLPGATKDYVTLGKGIMDNLVPSFKALDGSFDQKGYQDSLDAITKSAGFLAATSEVDTRLTSLGISKFLGGASVSALSRLRFFEGNPALLGFLESEAQKLGKDVKELTASERAQVLRAALAVPQEVIDASTKSIAGITEGFKSALFDPNTGIFGLMKDLDDKTKGNQSAYSAIGKSFALIFGSQGILYTVGSIFSKLTGIDSNSPMEGVRSGFLWLNQKLIYINESLKHFEFFNNLPLLVNNFQYMFSGIFRRLNGARLGEEFAIAFNGAIPQIAVIAPYVINAITKGALFAINFLGEFIGSLDYGAIFKGAGYVLANLDWGAIGSIALNVLGFAIVRGLAGMGLAALISSAGAAILSVPILTALFTVGAALFAAITSPIGLIVGGIALLGYLVYTNIGTIEDVLTAFLSGTVSILTTFAINLTNGFNTVTAIGGQMIVNFENFLTYLLQLPGKLMSQATQSLPSTIAGVPLSWDGQVSNKASGFTGSLIGAAMRESSVSPPGASLVVANSSEAILPIAQQRRVAEAIRGGSGASLIFNGDININVGNGDPDTIANQVMGALSVQWEKSKENFTLPGYT